MYNDLANTMEVRREERNQVAREELIIWPGRGHGVEMRPYVVGEKSFSRSAC
jgi:hypothetical protein